MASITVKMDDTKLNALQFQLGKKGMDFNQEIQNLMGPALEKFYERQVPAAVREFAEAMSGQQLEQAPQTRTRSGNNKGAPTPKEIIGQEKMQNVR